MSGERSGSGGCDEGREGKVFSPEICLRGCIIRFLILKKPNEASPTQVFQGVS